MTEKVLALSLDESAPDRKIAAIMERERTKIEEALKTVGEYVLSDDEGRIYVITASKTFNRFCRCPDRGQNRILAHFLLLRRSSSR